MTARLVVDLGAFACNLDAVRERIAPARLMLVVKDDAYGHGLEAIVSRARAEGVDWFGAFDTARALQVRAVAGPAVRVFSWLSGTRAEIAEALAADVDIGVGDAPFLDDVAAVARESGATARVHLKIDTGLHRNGIRPEEWPAAVARARDLEDEGYLRVVGVWSHIAEASDEEDDAARAEFDRAVAVAEAAGCMPEVRHLAASAAAFARPEFRYDLVRVGAFCYGIRSAGGPADPRIGIRPIAALVAEVTGRRGDAVRIGIGGLDGLPTTLGGTIEVATPGGSRRLTEVGLTESLVDGWPGSAIGDRVTIFGPGAASPTDIAESLGTVGEEVVVRISPLVRRDYA